MFATKGCCRCHALRGIGGGIGPDLGRIQTGKSFFELGAAMWNHGPEMAEAMKARRIARPTFQGKEMVDLIAYVVSAAKDAGGDTAQVIPGTPERGQKLFAEKGCVGCHRVGGKGGRVGPELGHRGHHVSLTQFAALMWNHGPTMWARMRERGIQVSRLTGQEMADVLAYLYVSHYFEQAASAARGQHLVQSKGCAICHSVRGRGGKVGPDFSTSQVVGSPASLIAAMWNHSRYMETQAQKQEVAWPILSGQELADIAGYLGSISKAGAPKKP